VLEGDQDSQPPLGPARRGTTENLRYYYLFLPTVDGSLSRRFGSSSPRCRCFTAMFRHVAAQAGSGVGARPVWRLMGVIFGTMFFLMFTPTKWVHHFGLFAAVGARWLRWPRCWCRRGDAVVAHRMAFLARCSSCWRCASPPPTAGGTCRVTVCRSTTRLRRSPPHRQFPLLHLVRDHAIYATWLHFASLDHGEGDIARALTAVPIPLAAGFMVLVFVGSMVAGIVRQ